MSDAIIPNTTEPTPDDIKAEIAKSDDPTGYDIRWKLASVLEQGFTEGAVKAVKKKFEDILYEIETDLEYGLKERLSVSLAGFICDMADRAVTAILEGNEERMRDYLSAREGGHTGRGRDHQVIHGQLFESGAMELRRRIVETHAELLKSERILDLEDQVRALVDKVVKLENQNQSLSGRLNEYLRCQ